MLCRDEKLQYDCVHPRNHYVLSSYYLGLDVEFTLWLPFRLELSSQISLSKSWKCQNLLPFFQVLSIASFVRAEGSFSLNRGLGLGVDFGVLHTQGWASHLLAASTHRQQSQTSLPERIDHTGPRSKNLSRPVKTIDQQQRCFFEKWESSKTGWCTAWGACRLGAIVHLDGGCTAEKVGAECRSV